MFQQRDADTSGTCTHFEDAGLGFQDIQNGWDSVFRNRLKQQARLVIKTGCTIKGTTVIHREFPYRPLACNQPRIYSASSRQPLSMVREWPRFANSLYSVTACDFPYALSALFTSTGGTVLSAEPEMSKSGPRLAFPRFTFVAEFGLKVAVAA